MASQARHEIVSPKETCAPRTVVPQEKGNSAHVRGGPFDRRAGAAFEFKNSDEMHPGSETYDGHDWRMEEGAI